jgi:hypothetical protein
LAICKFTASQNAVCSRILLSGILLSGILVQAGQFLLPL